MYQFEPVGIVHSCFKEKFGVPRQPSLAPSALARLELLPPFNSADAVAGLEHVSHLWLQFVFHQSPAASSLKVRPPRLGGNQRIGVFASRSPVRPNPIGLSVVKLDRVSIDAGDVSLWLSGVDLIDGTPVLDIKPYLPYADSPANAVNKLAASAPEWLTVRFADDLGELDSNLRRLIVEVLQQDPKPAYQRPLPERIYGMRLHDHNLQWRYKCEAEQWLIEVVAWQPWRGDE